MSRCILKLDNITKVYNNGVVANKNINFSVNEGEIHALVGENGAGKSTLMKIIFGMEKPSSGHIYLNEKEIKMNSSKDAINYGIGMVHQHFMLVPSFTVAENIMLGMEPQKGIFIDKNGAEKFTQELSEKYNLPIDPSAKVESLSVGMKQKVEILKALARGAKILILDEPTAVLTPQETELLFKELVNLKKIGHTIIFISHKLKEVKEITDRITVMKSGKIEGYFNTEEITEREISNKMVGRDVVLKYDKEKVESSHTTLKVKDITLKNMDNKLIVNNVSFSLKSGHILGIAGVEGNGQAELIEIITRHRKLTSGSMEFNNKDLLNKNIKELRELGIGYIPEDRISRGTAGDASIKDNLISNQYNKDEYLKGIFLDEKKINELSKKWIETFKIKCFNETQKISMLSGGNMQKVVVARECSTNPEVLIVEQPTRGVDIGAAQFIHNKLLELRKEGCSILLVSADLNEVMELSDSLMVMYEGEIVAYFENTKELTEDELGLCMLGIKRHDSNTIGRALND